MNSLNNNAFRTALIFSGGSHYCTATDYVLLHYKIDGIIAADSGLVALNQIEKLNFKSNNLNSKLNIEGLVGDFDSLKDLSLLDTYKARGISIDIYDSHKDDTDTMLAVKKALSKGYQRIILLGVTGSRIDHLLGNIYLLDFIDKAGAVGIIIDDVNRITLLHSNTHYTIERSEQYGEYISFLPFIENVENLNISGFEYNVDNSNWYAGSTLGISNRLIELQGKIFFSKGLLLMIESRDRI